MTELTTAVVILILFALVVAFHAYHNIWAYIDLLWVVAGFAAVFAVCWAILTVVKYFEAQ